MYKFFNPHPRGLIVNDCVKRAVVKTTGWTYKDTKRILNQIKNEIGADSFRSKRVGVELARREGWEHIIIADDYDVSAINGETFCKEHLVGKYILQMPHHWVACVDGTLYDTWDCSQKKVKEAWRIR